MEVQIRAVQVSGAGVITELTVFYNKPAHLVNNVNMTQTPLNGLIVATYRM